MDLINAANFPTDTDLLMAFGLGLCLGLLVGVMLIGSVLGVPRS